MKKFKSLISLGTMCLTILVAASGFSYGLGRVNGYCESGNWNPFKADQVKTDTYGSTKQKLTAIARIEYLDEDAGVYKRYTTSANTKHYGSERICADTNWLISDLGDDYQIRNRYSGEIFDSGDILNFSYAGYVYE